MMLYDSETWIEKMTLRLECGEKKWLGGCEKYSYKFGPMKETELVKE